MDKQIKVFFNLRDSSRERMWDTARQAERVCSAIIPKQKPLSSIERTKQKNNKKAFIKRFIYKTKKTVLRHFPLINYQSIPSPADADMLYMWGAFPVNTKKPFILELDNPFVLTYYNQIGFRLRLHSLKKRLHKAEALTFLSETARNHALELFGQEFSSKSYTLPPVMERNYQSNRRHNDGIVRFLFIGMGYRRKGLPELLAAFDQLDTKSIRLTVIADVDKGLRDMYGSDTRITFLPSQPRDVLFKDFYPTHDVFILPSLLESLGVVILEALSFGMAIITTDLYATPEMVQDGQNGRLLPHPFLKHTKLNGIPVIDCVGIPSNRFQDGYLNKVSLYPELAESTAQAITEAVVHYKEWQKKSGALYEQKYTPEIWESKFRSVLSSTK